MQAIWAPRIRKSTIAALVELTVTLALAIVLLVAAMGHDAPVPTPAPASPVPTICQVAGVAVPCS
jgi:hypothetical protein